MSQYQLSRRWFHKITDFLMPGNCRQRLEVAFAENKKACADLISCLNKNEQKVIDALKQERKA